MDAVNRSSDASISIIIQSSGTFEGHPKIMKPERISGAKREIYQLKAATKGIQAFRSDLMIEQKGKYRNYFFFATLQYGVFDYPFDWKFFSIICVLNRNF